MLTDAQLQAAILEEARHLVIGTAIELDPQTFYADADGKPSPGRLERVGDRSLAVAIELIALHGFADETASLDDGSSLVRVDRFILATDSLGFLSVATYASEEEASRWIRAFDDTDTEV